MARQTIHLIASGGGHVDLLVALLPTLEDFRRVWLVQPSARVAALRREGEEVHVLPDYDRNPVRGHYLANVWQSLNLVRAQGPRLVVTSGAGVVVPFCIIARLAGAKIVFIETMARVRNASASGRVLSRVAETTLVQWPELLDVYPQAILCQPELLAAAVAEQNPAVGEGTFVGVGTHVQPFDRLLRLVDNAVEAGILPEPVVAQSGVSQYRPRSYTPREWMSPEEIDTAIQDARYVACHAGSGIISSTLRAGRKPLVLARKRALGEHFDDHQQQIVEKLAGYGLIVPLAERVKPEHLAAADVAPPTRIEGLEGPSLRDCLKSQLSLLTVTGKSAPQERTA